MNIAGTITTPVTNGQTVSNANAVNDNFNSNGYWENGNVFTDWIFHRDTQGHNDALAAFERESAFNASEAEKARQFEKMMSDTQFQRKVADYLKAGFSPLAALEGNGSYQVSSAPAAAAHARGSQAGGNGFGALLGAVIMTVANFATKGIASAASNAANASKAALDSQKLQVMKEQVDVQKGWLDLAQSGRLGSSVATQKILRKASHEKHISNEEIDRLLDELEKL